MENPISSDPKQQIMLFRIEDLPRHQNGVEVPSRLAQLDETHRDAADAAGITPEIEAAFSEGQTAAEIRDQLGSKLDDVHPKDRTAFVTSVRRTLGIPSRETPDDEAQFQAWKGERDQRLSLASAQSPAAVDATPDERPRESEPHQAMTPQDSTAQKQIDAFGPSPAQPAAPPPHEPPSVRGDDRPAGAISAEARAARDIADRQGLTPAIHTLTAEGKTSIQIRNQIDDKLVFLPAAERTEFVRTVRKTLTPDKVMWSDDASLHKSAAADWRSIQLDTPTPTRTAPDSSAAARTDAAQPTETRGDARAHAQRQLDAFERPPLAPSRANDATAHQAAASQPVPPRADPSPAQSTAQATTANPAPSKEDARARAQRELAAFDGEPQPASRHPDSHTNTAGPASSNPPQTPRGDPPAAASDAAQAAQRETRDDTPANQAKTTTLQNQPQAAAQPQKGTQTAAAQQTNSADQQPQQAFYVQRPGVLNRIFAAARTEAAPAQTSWNGPQDSMAALADQYERETAQPRRDAKALTLAYETGKAAIAALERFTKDPGATIVLNKINEAAKNNPGGMPEVLSEMREGGKFADLRHEFNAALETTAAAGSAYDRAINTIDAYGEHRATASAILAQRPYYITAKKHLEDLDGEIAETASNLPGKKDGQNALAELAEKAAELLAKAFDRVKATFQRTPSPSADPAPSPGL